MLNGFWDEVFLGFWDEVFLQLLNELWDEASLLYLYDDVLVALPHETLLFSALLLLQWIQELQTIS